MLELYLAKNSICTQKVLMTLHEKELEWKAHWIDLFNNQQYDPAYLKLNPKGVVPTLVRGTDVVVESTLICEYLDQVYPAPALRPMDAGGLARMRLWSKAIDEGIFEATRELSFSAMFRERMRGMSEEQRQMRFRNVGDPGRQARYISIYEEGVESPYVLQAIAAWEKLFKAMETELADGRSWIVDGVYSLGDINLIPFVARLDYLGLLDVWTAERPFVKAWFARARALPSFAAAISDQLSAAEVESMAKFGSAIAGRVSKLRADYLREFGPKAA